jgi:hypothetical protein
MLVSSCGSTSALPMKDFTCELKNFADCILLNPEANLFVCRSEVSSASSIDREFCLSNVLLTLFRMAFNDPCFSNNRLLFIDAEKSGFLLYCVSKLPSSDTSIRSASASGIESMMLSSPFRAICTQSEVQATRRHIQVLWHAPRIRHRCGSNSNMHECRPHPSSINISHS